MFNIKNYKIPKTPGCYIMKDDCGEIIYIGKAKNLTNRVRSYFRGKNDVKTTELVSHIADIEFIITDTEIEALLLEAKLIYKHKPKYNIDLKDTIRYAYIKITNEEYPRIISTRKVNRSKDTFFGPYTDGTARRNIVYTLNKVFQLRTCYKLPKHVCLLYHIGQCSAPCENKISKAEYLQRVNQVKKVLSGNIDEVIEVLEKKMYKASQDLLFESAKIYRDQIEAIKKIDASQKISLKKCFNQDYLNYIVTSGILYIHMFNFNKGILSNRRQFKFDADRVSIEDFITQYYYSNPVPQEIIIPRKIHDIENIVKYLQEIKGARVVIQIPQKGVKLKLLHMLEKNLALDVSFEYTALIDLKKSLNLHTVPRRIECFDISNIGEKYTVGAMVSFLDGKPDKKNYRKFKIKTVQGQNDFAMMAEVVKRRYSGSLSKTMQLPDLIVIDGGKGQLHAADEVLTQLGIKIPRISLAKKEEEIFYIGSKRSIKLSKKHEGLKILQQARDEAHRFGITYHRLLRSKGMFE